MGGVDRRNQYGLCSGGVVRLMDAQIPVLFAALIGIGGMALGVLFAAVIIN